ncbi:hypothetical protein DESA109040_14915 [Deinococcus saxicola]
MDYALSNDEKQTSRSATRLHLIPCLKPGACVKLFGQQFDGGLGQPEDQADSAFERARQSFVDSGTPEVLARSAANIVVNFRQGKRVD